MIAGMIISGNLALAQNSATIVANQEICFEFTPDTLTSSVIPPNGDYTYQWQDSTLSVFGAWQDIQEAILEYYVPPALEDTTFYRLIVTGPGKTAISNVLVIAVLPEFNKGFITGTVDSTICFGADGGILTANPSGGSGSYSII